MKKTGWHAYDNCKALTFLPAFLRDETLYSWCCRYHQLSGNRLATDTSIELFGSRTAGLMHDFPPCLGNFVKQTNGRYGDVCAIAYQRTLLGFYAKFLTAEVAEKLVRDMKEGNISRMKFALGLPSSRIGAAHPLKACPVCIQEDEASMHVAYWHLEHQVPGRWICPTHVVPLLESLIKTRTVQRLQWILPTDIGADQWFIHKKFSDNARQCLEKIGSFINHLRDSESFFLDQKNLRYAYLSKLREKDWITKSGFFRMASVRQAFLTYAEGLQSISDYQFINSAHREDGGFLGSILRSQRRRAHPTKHFAVISFLFDNWFEFVQAYLSNASDHLRATPIDNRITQSSRIGLKRSLLELLSSEKISITRAAHRCGISIDTATTWAQQNNISFKRRPKVIGPSLEQKIKKLLNDGLDRDGVANENGVSRQAVDRILYSHPALMEAWSKACRLRKIRQYRTRFLRLMVEHPGLSIKEIRSIPGNGFQWLYRHDSEWLATKLFIYRNKG